MDLASACETAPALSRAAQYVPMSSGPPAVFAGEPARDHPPVRSGPQYGKRLRLLRSGQKANIQRISSLFFNGQRSHVVPAVGLTALDAKANRGQVCSRVQHGNAEFISTWN